MATTRSRQIFRWWRRRRLHFVHSSKLFYSIEVLHIHITCLHVYIVYIYLHLLPRTPDCVMAVALFASGIFLADDKATKAV